MQSTLQIGILGAARIAPSAMLKPARAVGSVNVAAVAARDGERARAFARKHGIARAYAGYRALLEDPWIDAVYIALPNSLHCEWSIRALEAGKHVLCEKPLASNATEAAAMVSAAERCGRVLQEGFHCLHHPLAQRVLDIVHEGTLGEIEHVDAWACIPVADRRDIRYAYELGGGALMDMGCYALRMISLVLGEEDARVVHACSERASYDVDRWTRAELRYASGREARMTCSLWSSDVLKLQVHVRGTLGDLRIVNPYTPHMFHALRVRSPHGPHQERVAARGTTYEYQLRAFVDAVHNAASGELGPKASIANMQSIDRIYRAMGMPVRGREENSELSAAS